MYRLVLIEDEPPILQMAKILIESFGLNFEVSGCAYNGEDGLTLIREQKPDVVITDIRMPMKDGLTLIQELEYELPDISWIILSGYAEFDYAVKALQLGVSDYILKPIDPPRIKAVLEKLIQELEAKQERKKNESLQLSLIEGTFPQDRTELFSDEVYYPALLVAGNLASNLHDAINPGKACFDASFEKSLQSRKPEEVRSLFFVEGMAANQKLVLFGGCKNLTEPVIEAVFSGLLEDWDHSIPLHVFFGSGITSIQDFPIMIQSLLSQSLNELHIGKSEVCRVIETDAFSVPYWKFKSYYDKLSRHSIFSIFKADLLAWVSEWEEQGYPQAAVEIILNRIIEDLNQAEGQYVLESWDIQELFTLCNDTRSLIDAFLQLVEEVYFAHVSGRDEWKSMSAGLAEEISLYLRSRYDQPISYEDLQDQFGYHKDYLAQLFRQQFHVSPNKYLTQIRMEHAKQLMAAKTALSLKQIATSAGYEDQLYFSKVFKSIEGVSPSKYREQFI